MLIYPVKISVTGFAILLKILSTDCVN